MTQKGILPKLYPLPAWETIPPGDIFRVFERGGRVIRASSRRSACRINSGALQKLDEPGRPDIRQSNRGPGTGSRIAVPVHQHHQDAAQRSAHVVPRHQRAAGRLSLVGLHRLPRRVRERPRSGRTPVRTRSSATPARRRPPTRRFPKDKSGHPLQHGFTRAIPSSQCMVCHMHQPNVFVNSFYGYTMWDYESDAPFMWPEKQKYPTRRGDPRDPASAIRRRRRSAASGATPTSCSNVSLAQSEAEGHAVRRLSRPRLEFPRGVQARPQGHAARQGRQGGRRQRSARSSRRRSTCRRSTWTSACTASTATSARTRTATATSTARSPRPSRSTARIATAPRRAIRTCSRPARRRGRAAPTCRCCARRTAAGASSGATASSTSARRSIPTRNGRCRWSRTRSIRTIRSTTRRRRARS